MRWLLGVALAVSLAITSSCGLPFHLHTANKPPTHSASTTGTAGPRPVTGVVVDYLGAILPRALEGDAAAASGGRIYIAGGSSRAGFSSAVYTYSPATGKITLLAHLPVALHDAAAVAVPGGVLVCGGGQTVGSSAVYHVAADGTVKRAGRMPRSLSDLGAAAVGGRPYCLGGWTGHLYSDQVYDMNRFAVVAHLPHAVRYAAVVPFAHGVLVAGGERYDGKATGDLQWVPLDGATGSAAVVGHLSAPVAYAMGATLGGTGLVIGGCPDSGPPVTTIDAVTPAGSVLPVGDLPQALCYGGAASLGDAVYLFGGKTAAGTATDHVWKITAKP